jgi:hypothetical protein
MSDVRKLVRALQDSTPEDGEWSIRQNVENVLYWEQDSVDHLAREQELESAAV